VENGELRFKSLLRSDILMKNMDTNEKILEIEINRDHIQKKRFFFFLCQRHYIQTVLRCFGIEHPKIVTIPLQYLYVFLRSILLKLMKAIFLGKDNMERGKTKHIDIKYHFLHSKERIEVKNINTQENPIDAFMKLVPNSKFIHCLDLLNIDGW